LITEKYLKPKTFKLGHERVGYLPKSKKWHSIVAAISAFSNSNNNVSEISRQTTMHVRSKFTNIEADSGVQSAYEFLVMLSLLPRRENWNEYTSSLGIQLKENFNLIELAQSAKNYVQKHQRSKEYSAFASQALIDTISEWATRNNKQPTLFFDKPDNPIETWSKTATGSGFCEISRMFFSRFTERYLKYFLERQAVIGMDNIFEVSAFNTNLERYVDDISKHAFETSKITESFAAGWYNKNVKGALPTRKKIRGFLAVAFGKINSELLREENK
jgi:hypothetical protein